MKTAVVFFVPIAMSSAAVCWRWRSIDGQTDSNRSFHYYHDCVDDALTNGYRIEAVSLHHTGQAPRTLH